VLHNTLNTAQAVDSPRSGVSQEAIEAVQPLIDHGGSIPAFAAFRVTIDHAIGSAMFTVWREQEPIMTCALAWTAKGGAKVWPAIERVYLDLGDAHPRFMASGKTPGKPASLPWLAVVLLPGLSNQSQSGVQWLGDFERCMSWAILKEWKDR
jgi:hypothetical protein